MIKKAIRIPSIALLYLISLLPLWMLYFISDVIFFILYRIISYRKHVIDENLKHSFPEKTEAERIRIRKEFVRYLADLVMETVKLLTISPNEVKKRVEVVNTNFIEQSFKNGQSVIGILGHYGNWELNALRFSQLFSEKRIIVYKPLNNKFFDNLMISMRSRFGATLVGMKQTMRKLTQYRHERTMTVLVGDQTPARAEVTYFTDFLNQPTAVFLGVEKLAKLTNSVVVFCDIRRIKRGYYRCSFIPLFNNPKSTDEYEITNKHVKYLEEVIRQQPQYWLWSHRRWKYKPEELSDLFPSSGYNGTLSQLS
ncbi:lysophospholipid acyltransferase family protein [Pedobacter sp. GR22-6]|uniref:lysophospholipid acyltransferase family protein n=1 Tax=Pedobacter sp. GR22-6 TaxID=3127957 RepID=UPI00307D6369